MRGILVRIWPLFLGLALIGLAVGAQGTLLGIRAAKEEFGTSVTGLVMASYFMGFLLGPMWSPTLIRQVGHVRTYGALTALASITILMHALMVNPWAWGAMRLLTGFSISGIYVVAESWLNRAASDETRGQILSVYMLVMFSGLAAGQFLLNIAEPTGFEIYSVISVLVSFAAIPILVSAVPAPPIEDVERVGLRRLFAYAPSGVVGVFLVNASFATVFGMAAVYTTGIGMTVAETSRFVAAIITGGMLLQWPLGKLSDRGDRRLTVVLAASAACMFAGLSTTVDSRSAMGTVYAALFGAFCFPLYAICLAVVNDYMRPEKIVPASGTLLTVAGVGAIMGPLLVSEAMRRFGPHAFFGLLALLSGSTGAYSAYRYFFHPFVATEDRHEFSIYAPSPVGVVLQTEDRAAEGTPPGTRDEAREDRWTSN